MKFFILLFITLFCLSSCSFYYSDNDIEARGQNTITENETVDNKSTGTLSLPKLW